MSPSSMPSVSVPIGSLKGRTEMLGSTSALPTREAAKALGISRARFIAIVGWLNLEAKAETTMRGGSPAKTYDPGDLDLLRLLREHCAKEGGRAVLSALLGMHG